MGPHYKGAAHVLAGGPFENHKGSGTHSSGVELNSRSRLGCATRPSGSTMIVADEPGNSGFLNSWSAGGSFFKAGSLKLGGGGAVGVSVLYSPRCINSIKGGSAVFSAAGGAVLGGGLDITASGALTITLGVGAGAEGGVDVGGGNSVFI